MGISRASGFGVAQSWQFVTRTHNTTYTNNTGKPIMLKFIGTAGATDGQISVEVNGISETVCYPSPSQKFTGSIVIPTGATYKPLMTNIASSFASELR